MSQLPPPDWNPFGTSSRPHGAPWFRQFAWTAAVVIGTIGVLVLAYLGACVASGESRSAILLSGLDVPYQVTVNGTSYALPPKAFREISVAEGDLDIVLQLVDGRSYTETVHLASPLLTRPFRDELVVLNPDRCAILAHDQGGYDVRPRLVDPDAFHRIHIGEVLYTFDHIEHVFEALPYDIRVSGPETRRSVRAVTTGMTAEQHQIIVDAVGATEAQRIVRRVLDLDPRNGEFLRIAAEFLDANEMAAHCRPSLDQRPLDI
ncbi:MAG: hypothetical protein KDA25_06250, partial [Phycisphaerales bacterium]|nr:hypothetical protein [Phycisphaerales bacterium]